jgi:hypothetical protein
MAIKRERASQAVFARYRPNGPSLKLLSLVKAKGLSSVA